LNAVLPVYWQMAFYLHLSLVLMFATTHPDSQFMIFFVIPVRAWLLALVYLVLTAIEIINLSTPVMYFPHNLFPLVALANYLLFAGSDIVNLLPFSWRVTAARPFRKKPKQAKVIRFEGATEAPKTRSKTPANHVCSVCGRTDISNPELEFRYCSRCTGYRCYCQDHINDHIHE
jgi:hypothetical protein